MRRKPFAGVADSERYRANAAKKTNVLPVEVACAFLIKHREFITGSQESGEG